MLKKKTNNFVSDLDEFLETVREETPLSASQEKEITKHKKIAEKRDHVQEGGDNTIWEDF